VTGHYNKEFFEFFYKLLEKTLVGLPFEMSKMKEYGYVTVRYTYGAKDSFGNNGNQCLVIDFEEETVKVGTVDAVIWKVYEDNDCNLLTVVLDKINEELMQGATEWRKRTDFLESLSASVRDKKEEELKFLSECQKSVVC
jgi:hypothetical protein